MVTACKHAYVNEETKQQLRDSGVIGVLHDVPLDIGGVIFKQHVFVVPNASAPLLLGRPFERAARAQYINEDDGSLVVLLRSQDGGREVLFKAAPAFHERNRQTGRPREEFYSNMVTVDLDTESDLNE